MPPAKGKRKIRSARARSISPASRPKRAKTNQTTTRQADVSSRQGSRTGMSSTPTEAPSPFTPYPPSKVYRLIEPGPVLLVSTGPLKGSASQSSSPSTSQGSTPDAPSINLMTMGFHMMVQHASPPLIAVCIGPWDATYARLQATRECVLAVPSAELAPTVVDIGNCSADDGDGGTDKFEKFGLQALPAHKVGAPLVGGEHVMANIECVVEDDAMVGKYNLWVLKVVAACVNRQKLEGGGRMFHHRGDGTFTVDGREEVLDLKEKMVKWKMFQD